MWRNEQQPDASYHCSFCLNSYDQASFLTAGPGNVFICRDCVDLYRRDIKERASLALDITTVIQRCRTCGTRAPSLHRYCFNCGTPFVQAAEKSDGESRKE